METTAELTPPGAEGGTEAPSASMVAALGGKTFYRRAFTIALVLRQADFLCDDVSLTRDIFCYGHCVKAYLKSRSRSWRGEAMAERDTDTAFTVHD